MDKPQTSSQRAADRYGITDTLHRYCHGIDRYDIAMLKSAFWADGTDDHGSGPVPSHAFCDNLFIAIKDMKCTQHVLSNILIDFQSDKDATTESYCVAYHQLDGPDGLQELVVGGRYLDQLEQRDAVWKIKSRIYVMDWNRTGPLTHQTEGGIFDSLNIRGQRYPNDASKDYVARL